jgi:hypothetical protein
MQNANIKISSGFLCVGECEMKKKKRYKQKEKNIAKK